MIRKLIMQGNMRVTVGVTGIGVLGTIPKGLKRRLEEFETTYRKENSEEARRSEETCCHLDSSERPSANAGARKVDQRITQTNRSENKKGIRPCILEMMLIDNMSRKEGGKDLPVLKMALTHRYNDSKTT